MKLEFSRQIFEKCSNIRLNENPPSGGQVMPCGRTDMAKELPSACCLLTSSQTIKRWKSPKFLHEFI